ncbi:MAG: spore maturation protein [Gemmatimonadetes bacterium]|nr:MAG: spore maturation protein [Gemmatimonadota bacterium]
MDWQALSNEVSNWLFLTLVAGIPLYRAIRKVKVYETFVEGAKEGFQIAVKIIPYLVAILVAIGMFRASGAIDQLSALLAPVLAWIGMPPETLPLAIIRPLSGSGANGIMAELINEHGGNSFIARVAATMAGSTETTFYVLAVYFGSVNIRKTRHAVPAGLVADAVGILAAVWVCRIIFGAS